MPAEIDTGGHRVLHCDSRADCPTATSIHVSTFPNDECQIDCVHLSEKIDGNRSNESQRRAPKDRRQKTENCVRKAELINCRHGNPPPNHGESSPTRVPRIGDKEETILGGRDFLAKSRVLTQPSHRRRGATREKGDENEDGLFEACRVSRESSRTIEDVAKDERFSVTWNSRKDTSNETERVESRLRDEVERHRLAIVDANGSSIARRRSLRDRSRTRSRPSFYRNKTLETTPSDHSEGTRTAGGSSLLSSHHSRTRAKDETYENNFKDFDEGFFWEEFGNDVTRTDENGRLDCSERRDERPEDVRNKRIGQNSASRKRIRRACRVYSFLQLIFLFFLIAFGRYGSLGPSNVRRISARPIANGLSVLGIGIIGAVNARSIDLISDAGTRAERSANLSHISGPLRKIQLYIKHRYLQILPDSTVNGTIDERSNYTIFQRISTSRGQLKIQSMATCLFVCMDSCGLLYGSSDLTAMECLFKEDVIFDGKYNTYSSIRWSTANKTLYLALNRYGQPRRVQAKGHNLGKLSLYARVLTRAVDTQNDTKHKLRHHGNSHRQVDICPPILSQEKDGRDRFRCRKRKKRKKRKRRCKSGEQPGPQCQGPEESITKSVTDIVEASSEIISASSNTPESKRSCEGAASEEACRRQALSVPAKKRKSRIDDGGRNLTLGKNKASTSNAKKPNVSVADSQSKKPDLTDGKKKKRKRTGLQQTSQGSMVVSPSRKQYEPGTTSSSQVSSSLMALASEEQRVSTATLSSSPSPPGASTALFSIIRPSSLPFDRKKLPPSSRNHVTKPVDSRRIGKFFSDIANLPDRPRSIPAISATSRSKIALTTKVPVDTCAYITTPLPQFSPVPLSSSLPWQESDEDSSTTLSHSSLVDEELSSTVTSVVTVESSTLETSGEVITEITFRLDEKKCEDGGCDKDDTVPRSTTRFPLERLAM
ncbi:PREDICTED: uncharacterized protein LOC108764609 [Trachymyrmex cornetzi]|nr:PREDICTED: uncharacterized protein LOC108764609 [Trachymyrmex cornetzi]